MAEKLSRLQRLAAAAKAHADAERARLEERAAQGDERAVRTVARMVERDRKAEMVRERIERRLKDKLDRHDAAFARRTTRISPSDVVAAALALLDEKGLEGVTMRDVAARLHVQAPALYWHFRSKRDLEDAMAQAILAEGVDHLEAPQDPGAWRPWMRQMAHALRAAMLSRREGGRIVAGAGLGRARALADTIALSLRVMEGAGFDPVTASAGTRTLIEYAFGRVIEEQADLDVVPGSTEVAEFLAAYPDIARAVDAQMRLSPAAQFDMGVELILRGLDERLPRGA